MTRVEAINLLKKRNWALGDVCEDLVKVNSSTALVCYITDHYESLLADLQIPQEKLDAWELERTEKYKKIWNVS